MANLDEWLDSIEHANLYRKSETFSTLGLIFSRYSTFFSNSEKIRSFESLFLGEVCDVLVISHCLLVKCSGIFLWSLMKYYSLPLLVWSFGLHQSIWIFCVVGIKVGKQWSRVDKKDRGGKTFSSVKESLNMFEKKLEKGRSDQSGPRPRREKENLAWNRSVFSINFSSGAAWIQLDIFQFSIDDTPMQL